jgi:ankyrin repeat protein
MTKKAGSVARVLMHCFLTGASVLSFPLLATPTSALFDAVRSDDTGAVESVIKQRIDVNARDEDGSTAIDWAAIRNNLDVATLLLKAGANPNLTNEQGIGALYLAIVNGSSGMVKLLLGKGADPNVAREDGETPLMAAAHLGQVDVMRMLLDHGAKVNARQKKFGQTELMWAAGNPAAVRLLLEHGADPRATTKIWEVKTTIYIPSTSTLGKTGIPWNNDGAYSSKQGGQNALLFAVQKHDLESARMLLDAGVDVNVAAGDGTTPLLAALYKFDPLGKEFVAGTGAPAPSGSSVRFGADIAMAELLLDRGARVNVADSAGYTPLDGAALAVAAMTTSPDKDRSAYGNGRAQAPAAGRGAGPKLDQALAMVRRLLDNGANVNQQTLYPTPGPVGDVRLNPAPPGSSAFHIAADSDCLELVRIIADHGGNPNLVRKEGHTPFSVAVLSRDVPIVKEMVARGADLNARYNPADHFADPVKPISLIRGNQSIMHIAAGAGAPEMIEYLYSAGARLDGKNSMEETPLDLADHQERFREARAREGAEDHPERVIIRDTTTTGMIKKLLGQSADRASAAPK